VAVNDNCSGEPEKKEKRARRSGRETIAYLEEKSAKEFQIREEELQILYLPVYNARPCIIRTLIFYHIFWKKHKQNQRFIFAKIMFIELTTTGK